MKEASPVLETTVETTCMYCGLPCEAGNTCEQCYEPMDTFSWEDADDERN